MAVAPHLLPALSLHRGPVLAFLPQTCDYSIMRAAGAFLFVFPTVSMRVDPASSGPDTRSKAIMKSIPQNATVGVLLWAQACCDFGQLPRTVLKVLIGRIEKPFD